MRGRRNRQNSPMSLFSLQDIITCLTGIMILIVLILALEVIESPITETMQVQTHPQSNREMEVRIRERQQELRHLRGRLEVRENPMEIVLQAEQTRSLLQLQSERLTALQQEITSLEQNSAQARREQVHRNQRREALEQQLAEIQRQVQGGEFQRVRFIPGQNSLRTPHLIEVSAAGVQVHSLSTPQRNRQWGHSQSVMELNRLMAEADRTSEFFVVMIKPSGIEAGMEIFRRLRLRGFEAGFDPLEESMTIVTGEQP